MGTIVVRSAFVIGIDFTRLAGGGVGILPSSPTPSAPHPSAQPNYSDCLPPGLPTSLLLISDPVYRAPTAIFPPPAFYFEKLELFFRKVAKIVQ